MRGLRQLSIDTILLSFDPLLVLMSYGAICLPNVPDQVSPLASGATPCASKDRDRSAEGMGINCIGSLAICVSRVRRNGTEVDLRIIVENAESLSDEMLIERFRGILPAYRRECTSHPSEIKSQEARHG